MHSMPSGNKPLQDAQDTALSPPLADGDLSNTLSLDALLGPVPGVGAGSGDVALTPAVIGADVFSETPDIPGAGLGGVVADRCDAPAAASQGPVLHTQAAVEGQFNLPMPEAGDLAGLFGGAGESDQFGLPGIDVLGLGGEAQGHPAGALGTAAADRSSRKLQVPFVIDEAVRIKDTKRSPVEFVGQLGVVKEVLLRGWYRVLLPQHGDVVRLSHRMLARAAPLNKRPSRGGTRQRPPPRPRKGSLPIPGGLDAERASECEAVAAIRKELISLEAQIPWTAVMQDWRTRRQSWRKSSKNARSGADLLHLLEDLALVMLIPPDAGRGAWMRALQECRLSPDARGLLEPFSWLKHETEEWLRRQTDGDRPDRPPSASKHTRCGPRATPSGASLPPMAPARVMRRHLVPTVELRSAPEQALSDARAMLAAVRTISRLGSPGSLLSSALDAVRRYDPAQLRIVSRAVAARSAVIHARLAQIAEALGEPLLDDGCVMTLRATDDDTDLSEGDEEC